MSKAIKMLAGFCNQQAILKQTLLTRNENIYSTVIYDNANLTKF